MRTHSLAHNRLDVSTWETSPKVQTLTDLAANEAMLNKATPEPTRHPGFRNAAMIGSIFITLVVALVSIAYLLG